MGCCGGGKNQRRKVKEWGSNQSSGNKNIKFIVIGIILVGTVIYKFIV